MFDILVSEEFENILVEQLGDITIPLLVDELHLLLQDLTERESRVLVEVVCSVDAVVNMAKVHKFTPDLIAHHKLVFSNQPILED